jgi:hypothetical protein
MNCNVSDLRGDMMYIVLHERYQEYNQFEGTWNVDYVRCPSLMLAKNAYDELLEDNDVRNVEILKKVKTKDDN